MTEQTLLEHSERIAKQEERINTHQAKYESALDRLQADMAERDAQRGTDALLTAGCGLANMRWPDFLERRACCRAAA